MEEQIREELIVDLANTVKNLLAKIHADSLTTDIEHYTQAILNLVGAIEALEK